MFRYAKGPLCVLATILACSAAGYCALKQAYIYRENRVMEQQAEEVRQFNESLLQGEPGKPPRPVPEMSDREFGS